ncbi:hypothetical protein JTB14_033942 [Gonioctena quinquepunctata]|nr:hypothetical protein JTB14_033942 [Gonioctena quinquepunctata]
MITRSFTRLLDSVFLFHISRTQKPVNYSTLRPPSGILVKSGIPIYVKKDEHYKICKKNAIKKLQELFNFRPFEASEIVSRNDKFFKIPTYNIGENYYSCVNQGITKYTMMKYPGILAESDVPAKIKTLKSLPLDINSTAPLILLNASTLINFIAKEVIVGRIEIIAKLLEVEKSEVCEMMARKPFLVSLDINNLTTNLELLLESGVTNEDVIKDLWVLKYRPALIEERIKLAKSNNIETIKTWMVRAQSDIFNNYVKRRTDNKSILGNNSLVEYLSERLECTEEVAKYIITKQPALQNKRLKKMNEIIDFLLLYGFKPIQICRTPKILLHSVETIKKRLKEMEALGMQLDTLYVLTKSQKQYNQVLETLIANKSKIKN